MGTGDWTYTREPRENTQKVTSIDNALRLIKTLLELNLYEDWTKMDIHVKKDGFRFYHS